MAWFSKRKMTGGMVFGAPGWMPERIEETFDSAALAPTEPPAASVHRAVLTDRHSLLETLATMKLPRTSAVIPGLAEQMESLAGRRVRALVLVLLPTQPEFVLGSALTKLAMEEMRAGMEALKKAFVPQETMVVIDKQDYATRHAWKGPAAKLGARRVASVNRYPKAHPTVLTRRLFGEGLPADALPTTRELLYVDPVSCWALGRYVRSGQIFADRPIQMFMQNAAARLLMGRIGETLGTLLKRFKALESPGATMTRGMQVIVNGMLTGREASVLEMVTGITESVSVRETVPSAEATPCIACGWCVDVCPTGLTPIHLMELNQRRAATPARSREAQESRHCIACGLCSYVCPTRLPLMEQTLQLRQRVGKA